MSKTPPALPQNLLDKAITYFNPEAGKRRAAARMQLAFLGGYTGARRDRATLAAWNPGAGSPSTDIIRDLPDLRGRSRDQMRNAPVATGALNTAVTHIVGTGLACAPAINAKVLGLNEEEAKAWCENARMRFDVWASSTDCDLARDLNFYGQQDLAQRTWFESGDAFVVTPRVQRAGRGMRLALQLIEADRVCNPNRKPDTESMIDGIEIEPSTGETLAVHIAKRHPGDIRFTGSNEWTRVPVRGSSSGRRNVLHLFKPLRPGQKRGVPWVAPILEPLKQLGRWTDNELNAAVTSSIFSVFVKMDADAFQSLFDDGNQSTLIDDKKGWSGALESGKAVNLLPGEDITTAATNRPNPEFDPFWTAIVRQIGMALEIPYEVLVMHFQSSYSAARGALLMAWKFFKARRDLLASMLCQPVYELWLADEVAEGRISAPGFFADDVVRAAWCKAVWTGDGPGSIDPVKEVAAARDRVELEISTLDAESMLLDGVPWDVKHAQRKRELDAQRRDGTLVQKTPSAPAAPEPPADGQDGGAGQGGAQQ